MELFTHLWAGLQNLIGIRPVLVVVAGVIVGILGSIIGIIGLVLTMKCV